MNDLDTSNVEALDAQLKNLTAIAEELIDIKTGKAKSGTNKKQLLYAIEQINKIRAIYDERLAAHAELKKEREEYRAQEQELSQLLSEDQKEFGNVFSDWFYDVFGVK